jgi:uncharacterized protein with HEPN domain
LKSDLLYVDHILECVRRIEEYADSGWEAFSASTIAQDAVVRNLQVLAESSKRVSRERQEEFPEIPWRQLAGFRNVAVHEYFDLDMQYIWEIVSLDLPPLKKGLLALRARVAESAI